MYSTPLTLPAVASRRPCMESSGKMESRVRRSAAVMGAVVGVGTCVRPRIRTSQLGVAAPTSEGAVAACCAAAEPAISDAKARAVILGRADLIWLGGRGRGSDCLGALWIRHRRSGKCLRVRCKRAAKLDRFRPYGGRDEK